MTNQRLVFLAAIIIIAFTSCGQPLTEIQEQLVEQLVEQSISNGDSKISVAVSGIKALPDPSTRSVEITIGKIGQVVVPKIHIELLNAEGRILGEKTVSADGQVNIDMEDGSSVEDIKQIRITEFIHQIYDNGTELETTRISLMDVSFQPAAIYELRLVIKPDALLTIETTWGSTGSTTVEYEAAIVPAGLSVRDFTILGELPIIQIYSDGDRTINGTLFDHGHGFYAPTTQTSFRPVIRSVNQYNGVYSNSVWTPFSFGQTMFFMSNSTAYSTADFHLLCQTDLEFLMNDTVNSTSSPPVVMRHFVTGGAGLNINKSSSGSLLCGVYLQNNEQGQRCARRDLVLFENGHLTYYVKRLDGNLVYAVYDDREGHSLWFFINEGSSSINSYDPGTDQLGVYYQETFQPSALSMADSILTYSINDTNRVVQDGVIQNLSTGEREVIQNVSFIKAERIADRNFVFYGKILDDGSNSVMVREY